MWEKSWPASALKPKGNILPSSTGPACYLLLFWTGFSRSPSAWVLKDWDHFPQQGPQRGGRMQGRTGGGLEAALGDPAWWQEGKRKGAGCSVLFPEGISRGVHICAMNFSRTCWLGGHSSWWVQVLGLVQAQQVTSRASGSALPAIPHEHPWLSNCWAAMWIFVLDCQWMRTFRSAWHDILSTYSSGHQIGNSLSPEGLGSGFLIRLMLVRPTNIAVNCRCLNNHAAARCKFGTGAQIPHGFCTLLVKVMDTLYVITA